MLQETSHIQHVGLSQHDTISIRDSVGEAWAAKFSDPFLQLSGIWGFVGDFVYHVVNIIQHMELHESS